MDYKLFHSATLNFKCLIHRYICIYINKLNNTKFIITISIVFYYYLYYVINSDCSLEKIKGLKKIHVDKKK